MQINLKTILISMVVAFLLFTADGKEVLGFVFLVASDPLGLLNDRELLKTFCRPRRRRACVRVPQGNRGMVALPSAWQANLLRRPRDAHLNRRRILILGLFGTSPHPRRGSRSWASSRSLAASALGPCCTGII